MTKVVWLLAVGCSAAVPDARVRVPTTSRSGCAAELDAAIGRAKTELLPVLPADEAFVLGRPAREHEVRLRPILDGVFGANPGGALTYRVECNANACKVDVNHMLAPPAWRRDIKLLADRAPGVVGGTQFVGDTVYVTTTPVGVETWREVEAGDCMARESELRDYDARLDVWRPMPERFAALPEAPERERIVRAATTMLGHFEIDCRGSICRIRGGGAIELLPHELKGLFDRVVIERQFERVLWAEQRGDAVARGNVLFEAVIAELDERRVADCKRLAREPGEIAFELVTEGDAIGVQAIGKRAATDAAVCLREVVVRSVKRVPLDGPVQLPLRPIRFWVHSAS